MLWTERYKFHKMAHLKCTKYLTVVSSCRQLRFSAVGGWIQTVLRMCGGIWQPFCCFRKLVTTLFLAQGKDIVHRDVAARNILISAELRAKISDFGLARFLDTGGYYLTQNYGRSIPLAWYAPEVIEFHKYSSKSDTWSFGVLLWEMFSFAAPPYFCDLASLADKLREGMRLPQPSASPSEVYEIMRGCWAFEAVNRPDFTELYKTLFDLLQQIWDSFYWVSDFMISGLPRRTVLLEF